MAPVRVAAGHRTVDRHVPISGAYKQVRPSSAL
jgi:hypothetical protein